MKKLRQTSKVKTGEGVWNPWDHIRKRREYFNMCAQEGYGKDWKIVLKICTY